MKKLILIINVFLFTSTVIAQKVQPIFTNNPFPKTITVSGSAEMEIIPDEIYVNIELKNNRKKVKTKKILKLLKHSSSGLVKQLGFRLSY